MTQSTAHNLFFIMLSFQAGIVYSTPDTNPRHLSSNTPCLYHTDTLGCIFFLASWTSQHGLDHYFENLQKLLLSAHTHTHTHMCILLTSENWESPFREVGCLIFWLYFFSQHAGDERIRLEDLRQKVNCLRLIWHKYYFSIMTHKLVEYLGIIWRSKSNNLSRCWTGAGMHPIICSYALQDLM